MLMNYENQPIGSIKAEKNKPYKNDFVNIDINATFLSSSNINALSNRLYTDHKTYGGKTNKSEFHNLIVKMANHFAKTTNFKEYHTVDNQSIGYDNWTEILNTINTQFKNKVYNAFKWNAFVPSRSVITVGSYNNRKDVSYDRLTADDAKIIDFWQKDEIQVINNYSRYCNKIPIWRQSMVVRNYDKNEKGLRNRDPDRASLDNHIHGYNMTNIYKTLDAWDNKNWFGV